MLSSILSVLAEAVRCGFCTTEQLDRLASIIMGCVDAPVLGLVMASALAGVWERWIGAIPEVIKGKAKETWNILCPKEFPTQDAADGAWLANTITDTTWDCITRVHGNRQPEAIAVRNAGRDRISTRELWALRRRKQISQADYEQGVRANGVIDITDRQRIELAEQWWPSATDTISWMLKDVQDLSITSKFGLFDEFAQKYGGVPSGAPPANVPAGAPGTADARTVKDYFDAAGVDEQTALSMWAAHWRNMAPHTLYEMLHRLRADKQGTTLVGDKEVANASIATTAADVEAALGQADYPPYWRERLMAISYAVMTRVDMRRAYEVGALSPEALVSALQDRGYTKDDATKLLSYYHFANVQLASRRPAANEWVANGYNMDLCRQQLIDQGLREDSWESVKQVLLTRRAARTQILCLRSYQKAFMKRVLPEDELRAALTTLPLPVDQAESLIAAWKCEREANHRTLTTANVKQMAAAGVLNSPQEVRDVLKQLGYRPRSLARLMRLWGVDKMKTMSKAVPITPNIRPVKP